MGQILQSDKTGVLSHSAGVITLTASSASPAWLTIGGQQYRVTSSLSRTIATDVAIAANTLYMIYAVLNSGVVEMRITTAVNSVGPSGFTSWKLIGAFQANGLTSVAFGSFVNIDGPPRFGPVAFTPRIESQQSNNLITLNPTGSVAATGTYQRTGTQITIRVGFRNGSGGTATADINGPLYISGPPNLNNSGDATDGEIGNRLGEMNLVVYTVSKTYYGLYAIYSAFKMTPVKPNGAIMNVTDIIANAAISANWSMTVNEWSNTPLKDL